MGEHDRKAHENHHIPPPLAASEDMSVAKDIAKRFEQLESQWLQFQKKSEKWDGETRLAAEQQAPSKSCELKRSVPSTAFSYSNPLFSSTHEPVRRRSAGISPRPATAPKCTRSSSSITFLTSAYSHDKDLLSSRHRKRLPMLSSGNKHSTFHKENFVCASSILAAHPMTNSSSLSSSSPSPGTNNNSSSEKCSSVPNEPPQANGILTPPIASSPEKPITYRISQGLEAYSKPSSSLLSQGSSDNNNYERQSRGASFSLDGPLGNRNHSSPDFSRLSKLPIRECPSNLWSPSLHPLGPAAGGAGTCTTSKSPTPDPATYSSGKGPPGWQIPCSTMEGTGSVEVVHSSRSPPPATPSASSARETDLHSDGSTLDPSSNLRGDGQQIRNSSQMLMDRHIISEGVSTSNTFSSQIIPEDRGETAERSMGMIAAEYSSPVMSQRMFKSEAQMNWRDRKGVSAFVQHKLDHTLSKVEWELRLSKRESKLRMAEETLLEEQQKLAETRLALSKCENILSQREEAVSHLEQKRDLETTLESVETGTMVMGKLVGALRDVLGEMDRKERALHELWNEFSKSRRGSDVNCNFDLESHPCQTEAVAIDLDGINLLAANGDSKEWCTIVINICERLVGFLSQETHLQKWAVLLERESLRIKGLEEEITKTKETTTEQFERAAEMLRSAEEQSRMAEEERATLSQEKESLAVWVSHLQERRKAVTECEREAASSLAELQKKAANLFAHESSIDGKALEISALQEELWATSMRLHDDQEIVNKERARVQERLRQVSMRERDAEAQLQGIRRLKEELESQREQFEREKIAEEKKRERAHTLQRDVETRLDAREVTLRDIESELEEKALAAESLAAQLNERENILKSMHEHCEVERRKTKESIAELEREKKRIKESEGAIMEAQSSKKSAEEAWARVSKERREADEYLKSVEDRVKAWEDRLRVKEKELQQQQCSLREIETRIQEEQDKSQTLHAKLVLEQETWTEELTAKQDSLAKRTKILENKENEIKIDLEKLTEERRLAVNEIKRFAEMEARAWAAEREIQTKHDEHLQEVRKHAKEYRAQIEELEMARREVEREFEEVHAKRDELQVWQREAEETLQGRIESFTKGKDELQLQIQEMKKLQQDIEQAGAQIIDRVSELDQASTELETQRSKVENSKSKLEALARNLAEQQELVKGRENTLDSQEEKIALAMSNVKRMTGEAAAKEENLNSREQALVDSEREVQDLRARLTTERRDLDKMIAEMEHRATTLKKETASCNEISRDRSREQFLIEEKRKENLAKEKDLAAYEATLKSKALSLEDHSQALANLEQQLQERLRRSQETEMGWEKLKEEQATFEKQRDTLTKQKQDVQRWKAEQDHTAREDTHRRASFREELDRQKAETLSIIQEREQALRAQESRLAERESSLQALEYQGKTHIRKDVQELRAQLNSARAELDIQKQYVEEKRRAADAIAATIEEREAKLKAKEKEIERREAAVEEREKRSPGTGDKRGPRHSTLDSRAFALEGLQDSEVQRREHWQPDRQKIRNKFRSRMAFGSEEEIQEISSQEETILQSGTRNESTKQEDASPQHLKEMEDGLQKEASKITQERASLKAQQKELEETRKAVQDVKMTLTAQLKATKHMVEDAALTAQNASREREAMEEERRKLEKMQREMEASKAAKEAELLNETKHLESMRASVIQEKTQAMEMLQRAARAVEQERVKALDYSFMAKEKKAEADLLDKERELSKTAEVLQREKATLEDEKAKLKRLQEMLERGNYDQFPAQYQQAMAVVDTHKEHHGRKLWDGPHSMREEKSFRDLQNCQHFPKTHRREVDRPECAKEFETPSYKDTMLAHGGMASESSSRAPFDCIPGGSTVDKETHDCSSNNWNDIMLNGGSLSFLSPESSVETGLRINYQMSADKGMGQICDHVHGENTPSKKRLENVMTSLMSARQASRTRLQRTENALLGYSPSNPTTIQVQQALNALSARLSLMEQIEDGLASHLRKAYEEDNSETEGVIIDKVELLCRMEEQQSLRAEWEEDMQQQLEAIGMLQASSRDVPVLSTPAFTTPVKGINNNFQSSSPPSDWCSTGDANYGRVHGAQDSELTRTPATTTTNNSGSSGSNHSQQYRSPPEWKTSFEPLLGVDSQHLSLSPLVDCHHDRTAGQSLLRNLRGREHSADEKLARRKLRLSPSREARYASHR